MFNHYNSTFSDRNNIVPKNMVNQLPVKKSDKMTNLTFICVAGYSQQNKGGNICAVKIIHL